MNPENNRTTVKVLFVCIGNSCRSPMAEAMLKKIIDTSNYAKHDWHIDSAGLADWNVGYSPEPRCIQVLGENGLTSNHIGRQITANDFIDFDFIFGMDDSNIEDLLQIAPKDENITNKIKLLGYYNPRRQNSIISDPYFERGIHGFYRSYDEILICLKEFVKQFE